MHDQKRTLNLIVDAGLVCIFATRLILIYLLLSPHLAYGLALLIGIWYIDAYLKKSFEYPNETLFADLSFAAFVFFAGQRSDSILSITSTVENLREPVVRVFPITLGLCILWLGNLRLCRGLIYPDKYLQSREHVRYVWTISILFAFLYGSSIFTSTS